jgi:peptidoglycan-associated lipoprotein
VNFEREEDAMKRRCGRGALILLMCFAFTTTGCPGKKEPLGMEGTSEGLDEESLGGSGPRPGGSLSLAQAGSELDRPSGPLADIDFEYDSFDLGEEARATLQKNAAWLNEHPSVRVELEGHCDDRGTVEYNLALGAKRAASAKSYLTTLGISAARVTTISYGEDLPLCADPTESCWARNRRAHFVVIGE